MNVYPTAAAFLRERRPERPVLALRPHAAVRAAKWFVAHFPGRVLYAAKANDADFVVPPLEALWWADDPRAFVRNERSTWRWTAMLRMPSNLLEDDLAGACEGSRKKLAKKGEADLSALNEVRLGRLTEGTCLQTLHIGPYTAEAPVLADLHDRLMPERGLTFNGPHHEVYLSDPRRVAPEKLKTLLRQPVQPK